MADRLHSLICEKMAWPILIEGGYISLYTYQSNREMFTLTKKGRIRTLDKFRYMYSFSQFTIMCAVVNHINKVFNSHRFYKAYDNFTYVFFV